jgi:hypothetical protein
MHAGGEGVGLIRPVHHDERDVALPPVLEPFKRLTAQIERLNHDEKKVYG